MAEKALTTKNGAIWVQPDGPNTQPHYLGCIDLDDIEEPLGASELIQCFGPDGKYVTKGEKNAPPEPVTTSLSSLLFPSASYLEDLKYPFTLFVMQNSSGRLDLFNNYVRGTILNNAKVVTKTDQNLVHHAEENESMQSLELNAWPPVVRVGKIVNRSITNAEVADFTDIFMYPTPGDVANPKEGEYGLAVAKADSGVPAEVYYSTDFGSTWTATAAQPFGNDEDIMSCTAFKIDSTTVRFLVARAAPAGAQGEVAYSDDNGATWTVVNIGGATAGHGADSALGYHALFGLDIHHVWLASVAGYIYFSDDGGVSWSAQTDGSVTASDLHAIHFLDADNGMSMGAGDAIVFTSNGGETWELATATGDGGDGIAVAGSGDFWWVATDDGKIYYSSNDGTTWSERTGFSGAGTGDVKDIYFMNEIVGFMLKDTAGPIGAIMRTIDGGYTWEAFTTPTNAGLNSLAVIDENTVLAVGNVYSALGVIIKGPRS